MSARRRSTRATRQRIETGERRTPLPSTYVGKQPPIGEFALQPAPPAPEKLRAASSLGQPRPASASLGQSAAWFALAGHTGIVFHVGRAREEVHTAVGHSVQPEQVRRQQVLPLLRERVDSRALQEGGGRTGRQRHLCREQADSAFGTAGAPEMFIRSCFGCPWLLSASADQPVGRHWTAISGVTESATRSSTSCRAGPASGGQLRSAPTASVDEAVQGQQGGAGEGSSPSSTGFADTIPIGVSRRGGAGLELTLDNTWCSRSVTY